MLPDCVAWIVQVPTERRVTVDPDTEQTLPVVEAKLTASVELAVALTANDPTENEYDEMVGVKVMVWPL